MVLIREFLKRQGLEVQIIEDTIQDMEDAFSREGFDLDPIEYLRGMILPEFFEATVEKKEVDNSNEEIFECLKKITE